MSQENVELISASFALWREGRTGEWIETLDADIEWDISAHPLPDFPDRGSGREAFVGHMGNYLSGWTDYEASTKELIDRGDTVVVMLHERARMPDSDMMLDRDLPTVWDVRDGRAVRLRVFKSRGEALEAAKLEPRRGRFQM
jgi:ketosteroid isomerase-like protein